MLKQKFIGVHWETDILDQIDPFNTNVSLRPYTIKNMYVVMDNVDIKVEARYNDLSIVAYNKNMRYIRLLFSSTQELKQYFNAHFIVVRQK